MEALVGISLVEFAKFVGLFGIGLIIFLESGVFFGFFLPGDSLLFTAGFLASQGAFDIRWLIPVCFLGAILGVSVGYAFGRRVGPKIFVRDDSFFFHKDHVDTARAFYLRHGAKAIVLARFIPVVRTFAPILAGVAEMPYPTFLWYNILGAVIWAIGIPAAGYYLGSSIPGIDRYLWPIVAGIVVISSLPSVIHFWREYRKGQRRHRDD